MIALVSNYMWASTMNLQNLSHIAVQLDKTPRLNSCDVVQNLKCILTKFFIIPGILS